MCPFFAEEFLEISLETLKCPEKIQTPRDAAPEASATHHPAELEQEFGPGALGSATSDIGAKVGHSVLCIALVLLTATALYRYIPVSSWIHKLRGYGHDSINDMDGGEMERFLLNTQESADMFFGDTQNYISYQPM
ncbi:PIR Superfamily Protein [Plasmodium ovale wallikeri]|uniref:PIR Superfamily Protein n=1 Tax=Plasmodium ovale wallikeri TaxID=864142 RepID=A0A1A9AKR1_PLAOA|nr:PIR Superfamily Protein [Plasmodium ovale wallikeri]